MSERDSGNIILYHDLQAKRGVQSITAYNPLAQIPMAATDAIARMWMGSPFAQPYQQTYGGGYGGPPSPYPSGPAPMVDVPPPNGDAHEAQHAEPNGGRSDDVAAMRRELEELKQAVRESIASRPAKKSPAKKKT